VSGLLSCSGPHAERCSSSVYTWSPYCPDDTKKLGLTCIPMLWGPNQVGDFQKLVVEGYSNIVASFNE
jgi:hypothetical protein